MNKIVVIFFSIFLFKFSFAHDGGHGPKVSNNGKYGGKVAAVILASEESKSHKAKLQFKAEATVEGKTIRIYLYDKKMNKISLKDFQASKKKAKVLGLFSDDEYSLKKGKRSFEGTLPKGTTTPFSTDVFVKKGGVEYFVSFSNVE